MKPTRLATLHDGVLLAAVAAAGEGSEEEEGRGGARGIKMTFLTTAGVHISLPSPRYLQFFTATRKCRRRRFLSALQRCRLS
jgi:hypothetical protein